MSLDPSLIDHELRKLKVCALDDEFLARLEACASGHDLELSELEIQFERELRNAPPMRLSPGHLAELTTITRGTAFAVDDKIVLFPKSTATAPPARRSVWQAAAAVALIGAVTALLIPQRGTAPQEAAGGPPAPSVASQEAPARGSSNFSPAGFNRGLAEAHDEGVFWQAPDRPHRVLRIVYMDRVTLRNNEGKLIEVEQPRMEYILVPEKID